MSTSTAHTFEAIVEPDGSVVLGHVPLPPGQRVEVIVLVRSSPADARYSLRGQPYRFDDPFTPPLSDDEWQPV